MTLDEVLTKAQAKWPTQESREVLLAKYRCAPNYIYQILTGNKRIPGWMLAEFGS